MAFIHRIQTLNWQNINWRGWVIPLLFILLWSVASWQNWVNPKLIPAPIAVLHTAWQHIFQLEFWQSIAASLGRDLSGFAIGSFFGIAFGILVGSSKIANYLFSPSFNVLRQVSLFAWLPLITTFLDHGNGAKILFISLSVFYPVALHTIDGVRGISAKQYEVAQVYAFSRWQLLRQLILPAAAPQIFVGLQLGLIFAWLATIGSEFLLASYGTGLGNLVIQGRAALDVALIVFGLIVIGLIGILLNSLANQLERRWLHWRNH
ncbi:ABC transporter permease [Acinetobacter puyangensis]|uniref:ABC transporter permease n=1 Tax=Acinetobacter puyangensis TaxID=1096779 RepID=UPI003A4D21AD